MLETYRAKTSRIHARLSNNEMIYETNEVRRNVFIRPALMFEQSGALNFFSLSYREQ